jgi:tRNA (cytidine/uridine-2'-O-)-methyltransferase
MSRTVGPDPAGGDSTRGASIHVALVTPEIAWNTGNAGRTCLAAGAQLHLVRPLGFSLDEREVRRAGVDYWPRVNPVVWDDLPAFEAALPALGEPYFFSAEAPHELWDVSFPQEVVLVFGRESGGLPDDVRARHPDRMVCIPMADTKMRSLNVSTAVAVALYEVVRQRRTGRRATDLRAGPPKGGA